MTHITDSLHFQALRTADTRLQNAALKRAIQAALPDLVSSSNEILKVVPSGDKKSPQGKRIAVCLSGGPAPGGHNVILSLAKLCKDTNNRLYGILNGPGGLVNADLMPVHYDDITQYFNTGGFDLLGTDRTKIKDEQQYVAIEAVVKTYNLDAIIIVGGDDSQTNAVFLAQRLKPMNCAVVGVPKTIDGDLRYPPYCDISFGFYTAVETYSRLVNALVKDTRSTKKYWHVVKLMGRKTGHIAKAVADNCDIDVLLLGEQVKKESWSFDDIINHLCAVISAKAEAGKNYGVICVAEGLLEWIPDLDIQSLVDEPLHYDSHGNLELSRIEIEHILIKAISKRLDIKAIPHFYGYEGRCVAPNGFDAEYCTRLGLVAGSLALQGYTGYMASRDYGLPILHLLNEEARLGKAELVVEKFGLNLD